MKGTAKIAKLGDKFWGTWLRWYEQVKKREENYVKKRMIEMAITRKEREKGKMDEFGERRHGGSWSKGGRRC